MNKERDLLNGINIGIVGTVSSGKSTLLNALLCDEYSECILRRTTMTPKIYYQYKTIIDNLDSRDSILEQNNIVNQQIIYTSEKNIEPSPEELKEYKYRIYKPFELLNNVKSNLNIFDMPPTNDSRLNNQFTNCLKENMCRFDIVLFVVDINSALNTSDENKTLEIILEQIKINKLQIGIETKLIVVANKCDDMSLDDHGGIQLEEEHYEMFAQINTQVKKTVSEIFPKLEYDILPLSSEDSFIYRTIEKNPDTELDLKYLNKCGYSLYGRNRWNKLSHDKKLEQIKKFSKDLDFNEYFKITGFKDFEFFLSELIENLNCELIQKIDNNKIIVTTELLNNKSIRMNTLFI